jgi:serine/threonine-protein kinase
LSYANTNPGTILAGKYRVERVLGRGGMGVVVEARHISLDDRVALKFLLPEYALHPDASQRFLREARAAVRIKGPHVARVSDVGTLEDNSPYMVMEYLEGADAARLLERGTLPAPEAIDYVVQACDAINEAHALGIIHRDLKPANLFVTRHHDGTPFVKVLDFGISKVIGDGGVDALTHTAATMGSALYMSPEQIRQSKSVDSRTDIYALGVTLYELLAGRPPFVAESFAALCVEVATGTPTPLRTLRPDVPPALAAAIEKAYARDPAARYQSVGAFVVALAPWALPRSQPIIERIARSARLLPGVGTAPAQPGTAQPFNPATGAPAISGTDLNAAKTLPPTRASVALWLGIGVLAVLVLAIGGGLWAYRMLRSHASDASAAAATDVRAEKSALASATAAPTPSPALTTPAPEPVASASSAPERPVATAERPRRSAPLSRTEKPSAKPVQKPASQPTAAPQPAPRPKQVSPFDQR